MRTAVSAKLAIGYSQQLRPCRLSQYRGRFELNAINEHRGKAFREGGKIPIIPAAADRGSYA